ncbi:3'-5' exonuclease, partial [Patescibacteria group bacterium]|nr:3'-5' exonuclease [Patescibacteria group bacterium]
MKLANRPIAITDLETTGLDSGIHEIIDIGLVVIDQRSLKIITVFDTKVWPEHIETATEQALAINGYNQEDWQNALPLHKAIELYSDLTADAVFSSWNVTFDWSFMNDAFKKTGVPNSMDYHRIDLLTVAWMALRKTDIERFNMGGIARHLSIAEEPMPHRAINGAMTGYEIFKQLV